MKILLINLDRSAERLAYVDAQLRLLGVAYERVAAVDGSALPPRVRGQVAAHLTPGEIGCLLSHQAAWQKVATGPDQFAIILEDDVMLSAGFAALASDESWIPSDAGLVKLETTLRPVMVDRVPTSVHDGIAVVRLLSDHYGSASYVVSKAAAAKLLLAVRQQVDLMLFDPRQCRRHGRVVYQVVPAVSIQNGSDPALASIIRPERRHARRHARGALRALFTKARSSARKRAHVLLLSSALLRNTVVRKRIPFARALPLLRSAARGP